MYNVKDIECIDNFYNEFGLSQAYMENSPKDDKLYSAYLKNLRDIKKLLNAFYFHYAIFKKKNIRINISDLLLITAIKTFNYTLWESIYKNKELIVSNKRPFKDERHFRENNKLYIEKNKSNNSLFNWKVEMRQNSFIDIAQLKTFEVRIIQSLFPFNKPKSVEIEEHFIPSLLFNAIEDHNTYSLKRIKDSLQTFMLYFQFDPSESHLSKILEGLENYHKNPKILNILKTDTDYSDLFDIVNSDKYKKYRNNQIILNILSLILENEKICEILYQDENNFIFSPEVNKMEVLPLAEIQDLIKQSRNKIKDNFNSIIKVIYDIFMYRLDRSARKDIRQDLSGEESKIKEDLIGLLKDDFAKINFLAIEKTTFWNLYYAFCWEDLIKQKAYDMLNEASDEFILDFFIHFANEGEFAKDSIIGKYLDISFLMGDVFDFNDPEDRLLKRFNVIKNNTKIMSEEKYCQYFGGFRFNNKYIHLVNYVIEQLMVKYNIPKYIDENELLDEDEQ